MSSSGRRRMVGLAGAVAAATLGCSREQAAPPGGRPPAAVTVASAEQGTLPVAVRTVGNVQPLAEVMLRPQVSGQVVETPAAEGTHVEAGTVLVVLDDRPYRAALSEAEANAARDRALAQEGRRVANQFATARASNAANQQEAEAASARAAAAEAQVQADEAVVETAKLNLEYCRVTAPFAGRLGTLLVKKGAIVKANETDLVSLVQLRPIEVGFAVPERQAEDVRAAQSRAPLRARASVAGDASGPVTGEVSFIDNRVDTTTGTLRLKARFANDDGRLWPGQFVEVVLVLAEEEGVIVPAGAVQPSQAGSAVWVVAPDKTVEMRAVGVRRQVDGRALIESGVRAGETVVTEGHLRLAPGMKVDIKATAGAADTRAER